MNAQRISARRRLAVAGALAIAACFDAAVAPPVEETGPLRPSAARSRRVLEGGFEALPVSEQAAVTTEWWGCTSHTVMQVIVTRTPTGVHVRGTARDSFMDPAWTTTVDTELDMDGMRLVDDALAARRAGPAGGCWGSERVSISTLEDGAVVRTEELPVPGCDPALSNIGRILGGER